MKLCFCINGKNRINRRPYWNYAIFRDRQIRMNGGHIGHMLFIEVENLEFPGSHIEIILLKEMEKKKELIITHIEIMLFIEMEKI